MTETRSLWIASTPETEYTSLGEGLEVDVAVAGGGITGITTAFLLKRAGKSVALLEARRILRGATGHTTAKVTAAHNLIYAQIEKSFGVEGACVYAEANQAALELIAQLIEEESIECEFERRSNFVYCENPNERSRVEQEVEAARRAGLAVALDEETSLPYPVECAFRLDDQAQFHPGKYLLRLAAEIDGDGGHVFERTRVLDVKDSGPLRVVTDRGTVIARDVVLATGLPVLDRGFFFAMAHPQRSYAVATRIQPEQDPHGMYINVGTPTRSIRTAHDERGLLLLLGGEGHKPGTEPNTPARYRALEEFASRHWQASDFPYRWSTQDYTTVDGLPYVGRLSRRAEQVYVATGFRKWGMTNGTAAAVILTDLILGRHNHRTRLFDSQRLKPLASAPAFVKENLAVAKHFIGDRLNPGKTGELEAVAAGEGRIMRVDGHKTAVYRDEQGQLHTLSPTCSHLGCHVAWNPTERSWDCPCHGSRFSGEGTVIQGPATRELRRREVSAAGSSARNAR
jgi:glycine/D-amino acid oxidase-like deaminating enzyme